MSLIKWTPLWDPFEEMEKVFQNFPSLSHSSSSMKGFVPAMDMYQTKDAVMVETPLVGVDPNKVEVSVENGVLTIKGESKKEHEVEEKEYYRKEIHSGSFFRQIALPVRVKEDAVKAEFVDGLLKITAPKAEQVKVKTIPVEVK